HLELLVDEEPRAAARLDLRERREQRIDRRGVRGRGRLRASRRIRRPRVVAAARVAAVHAAAVAGAEIAAATAAAEVAAVAVAEVAAAVRLTLAHAFLELRTLFRAHRRHALFHALATLFALLGRHVGEVAASAAAEVTPALVGARLSIGALARRVLLLRVLRGLRIGPLPRVR